ncbi:MAG: arylsulfatase A-like enzyme [Arenicella sp.]|jgi:arylsulfatase A-like enzyme
MKKTEKSSTTPRPNILMFMVDQMRFPRFGYGKEHGFVDPLKRILGFQDNPHDANEFRKFFPGLSALANNAVVLQNHKTASAACVPSRTALFSGQYGTKTGSVQTDGIFKDGASDKFPWLDANKFPTLGHWMRKHGYSTHYFGKWHISGEKTTDLESYGFSDWELSYPDPHGTLPNNLGYYRDYQFEDVATSFLRRQGLGIPYNIKHAQANVFNSENPDAAPQEPEDEAQPWFAVSSFTNPHDIGAYPGLPSKVSDQRLAGAEYTLAVPSKGTKGELPNVGTMEITLNKDGFPQNNANVAPTWNEELVNKPDCQFDYSYKMGMTLASKAGRFASEKIAQAHFESTGEKMSKEEQLAIAVETTLASNKTGLPFALTEDPELSCRAFMQYYGYLMHEVDQHISNVLKALDESGQADNTIVLFCADHGEYGGSHHMMMEKWHSAYEELLHVPMLVRFPVSMHQVPTGVKQVTDVTSHIDLFPTILGLAGADSKDLANIRAQLQTDFEKNPLNSGQAVDVLAPVGTDLSSFILGEASSSSGPHTNVNQRLEREGVLFITHDTITSPFADEEGVTGDGAPTQYEVYKEAIRTLKANKNERFPAEVEKLSEAPESVMQPNHVHCVVSDDNWKLVRYFEPIEGEPNNFDNNNQYELYNLNTDPTEINNLVQYNQPIPTDSSGSDVDDKVIEMKHLLEKLEKRML